jgi:thioredoxin reductase (NADPH)
VVGPRYGLRDYQVRNFLSRNQVPYVWLDPERDDQAVELLAKFGVDDSKLPVVLFPDGTSLVQPGDQELAQRVGLRTQAKQDFYDLVVVGAGMAGLAAAVYGASEGLKTLVLEPEAPGGQAGSSSKIENYLGFPRGVSGERLARDAYDQARKFGAEFITQRATTIVGEGQYRKVRLGNGAEVSCRVGLIAVGVCYRKIEAAGDSAADRVGRVLWRVAGRGAVVHGRDGVHVVGGANSAGQAAMHFSRVAKQVTMLVRGDSLERSMSKYLIDQIAGTSNISVETQSEVLEAMGDGHLESLKTPDAEGGRSAAGFVAVPVHRGALRRRTGCRRESCAIRTGLCCRGAICGLRVSCRSPGKRIGSRTCWRHQCPGFSWPAMYGMDR